MNDRTEKLALLNEREAENMAVEQFTALYNETDEKDLDISKLELVLRNTFYAGMVYKEAVMAKEIEREKANTKSYEEGVKEMRDIAIDADGDDDFFDKVWDKANDLISDFNSK